MEDAASHIHEAILHGRTDIVKILLAEVKTTLKSIHDEEKLKDEFDIFINKTWCNSTTFLHLATLEGRRDIIRALLQEGGDPSVKCKTVGDETLKENALETAKRLDDISAANSLTGLSHAFEEIMFQATASSSICTLQRLIDSGVSLSVVDTPATGNTMLHWATSFSSSEDVLKLFIANGADVNVKNANGAVPLHEAVEKKNETVIRILLEAGARMDIVAEKGKFRDKSPQDIVRESKNNEIDLQKINQLMEVHINSTCDTADDNDTELAKVHSTSHIKGSSVSNISVEYNNCDTNPQNVRNHTDNNPHITGRQSSCKYSTTQDLNRATGSSPVPTLITDERLNLLWPQPKHIHQLSGVPCRFRKRLALSVSPGPVSVHEILDVWDSHRQFLSSVGRRVHISLNSPRHAAFNMSAHEARSLHSEEPKIEMPMEDETVIFCHISERLFSKRESYRMTIINHKIRIVCSDLAGLHYAIVTLVQLFRLFFHESKYREDDSLHTTNSKKLKDSTGEQNESLLEISEIIPVNISDYPDCAGRAILLDLNPYGRVPKKDMLFSMVDTWSMLKINQLHVFFRIDSTKIETSFLPYGKSDILTLDRYCRDRFIDLVPAIDLESGTVINKDEKTVAAIRSHLLNILSCFDRPRFVHVGPMLTSFIYKVTSFRGLDTAMNDTHIFDPLNILPISYNETTLIMCSNALDPAKSTTSVTINSIMLRYGFQTTESFYNALAPFGELGCTLGTCTGTCSWSSLAGSPGQTLNNGYSAARAATKLGDAICLSVTAHWSSHPALGHLVFAWPGFLTGAGQSWNNSTPQAYVETVLDDLLDVHVLGEWKKTCSTVPSHVNITTSNEKRSCNVSPYSVGMVLLDLGRAESFINERVKQCTQSYGNDGVDGFITSCEHTGNENSVLLQLLIAPNEFNLETLNIDDLAIVIQNIKRAQNNLSKCHAPIGVWSESYRHEIRLTAELMLLSARIGRALLSTRLHSREQSIDTEQELNSSRNTEEINRNFNTRNGMPLIEGCDTGARKNSVAMCNLQPTFRTDIANKLLSLMEQFRALWLSRYESEGMQGSLFVLSNLTQMLIPTSQNKQME